MKLDIEEIGYAISKFTGYNSRFNVEPHFNFVKALEYISMIEFGKKCVFYGRYSGTLTKQLGFPMIPFTDQVNQMELSAFGECCNIVSMESLIFKERVYINTLQSNKHQMSGFLEGWLFKFE